MPINRTIFISGSVGRGGRNARADVSAVQSQLNDQMNPPRVRLAVDGIYGPKTRAMIRDFQATVCEFRWPDCRVDPNGQTLAALNDPASEGKWARMSLPPSGGPPPILHNVRLIPQPTRSTCWAASTAMLTGRSVSEVQRRTPAHLVSSSGGLKNYSRDNDWVDGTRDYANAHGLRYAPPMSWSTAALRAQLAQGPMVFDMLWRADQYVDPDDGVGSPGHMICVIGLDGDALDTELTYNDPWPPNVGAVTTVNYADWVRQVPTRTYRVFYR